MLAMLAIGDIRDITCTIDDAHDTALLATTINASAAGDLLRIHGSCLVQQQWHGRHHDPFVADCD